MYVGKLDDKVKQAQSPANNVWATDKATLAQEFCQFAATFPKSEAGAPNIAPQPM